jgi:hypothetical protein
MFRFKEKRKAMLPRRKRGVIERRESDVTLHRFREFHKMGDRVF